MRQQIGHCSGLRLMKTQAKTFNELTNRELYDVLQLRAAVFVVEQDCVYQDLDGKDQEAVHVLGMEGQNLVAYTRIFEPGTYYNTASIGRVVVSMTGRNKGYGKGIMEASIREIEDRFGKGGITISAQSYLRKFYKDLGFKETTAEYLEDGIPHVRMVRK